MLFRYGPPTVRIGHYCKHVYDNKKKSVTRITGPNFKDYDIEEKTMKTRGRIWHSFPLDWHRSFKFRLAVLSRAQNVLIASGSNNFEDLDNLQIHWSWRGKSRTFRIGDSLYAAIKQYGWPEVSSSRIVLEESVLIKMPVIDEARSTHGPIMSEEYMTSFRI